MKQEEIIRIFHKRFKKIRNCYQQLVPDFEQEAIHDFRLEIKKLRAFIRLINAETYKPKQLRIAAGIKDFYHSTGEIRNLQLHQQRVLELCASRKNKEPAGYLDTLLNAERKQKEEAGRIAEKISVDQFEKHLIHLIPASLNDESVQYFILQRQRAFSNLVQDSSDEALHDIRKILKDLLYTWRYICAYVSFFLPQYFTQSQNIEGLATRLGDFQDLCIALDFFEYSFIDSAHDPDEKALLQSLKEQSEQDKAILKKELQLTVQGFSTVPVLNSIAGG